MGRAALWILMLGASFTFGRVLHAIGLSRSIFPARMTGMLVTRIAMILIAGMLIYHGFA
jgi:hypothetical protein